MRAVQYALLLSCFFYSCKKDITLVPGNEAPYYSGIPTVKVENYINRLFIDLIGREALDTEMAAEVAFFRANELSVAAREQLITKLQTDDAYLTGDSSYKYAYYNRFYELSKARMIEGVPDSYIYSTKDLYDSEAYSDSLFGDSISYQINKQNAKKLLDVINIQSDYRLDSIDISEVYARLLNNAVYDNINMNSFNFIRASFDNTLFRFPSQNEFNAAYDIIEFDKPNIILGKSAQNKGQYIQVLVHAPEFYEGIIKWLYLTFLSREASSSDVYNMMQYFYYDHNVQKAQMNIMKTDEYANF